MDSDPRDEVFLQEMRTYLLTLVLLITKFRVAIAYSSPLSA